MTASGTHPTVRAIQDAMDERGLTKSELARRLEWTRVRVQRRLTGKADISVAELEQIADALDMPAADLLPERAA